MAKKKYPCPECKGNGSSNCSTCGHESECEHCDATGLDPDEVDLDRLATAQEQMRQRHGRGATSIIEGDFIVGWRCHGWPLYFREFLREDHPDYVAVHRDAPGQGQLFEEAL